MILTGPQIAAEVGAGRIIIDDFAEQRVEPNSYGFRLADELLVYDQEELDCAQRPRTLRQRIGAAGTVLLPGRLYLGSTMESMGSDHYAALLYARRSLATLGLWIQFSAPLGHCGAIFPWTLEITAACPIRLYSGMTIGKIAFWKMAGDVNWYAGKYSGSRSTVSSRLSMEIGTAMRVGSDSYRN